MSSRQGRRSVLQSCSARPLAANCAQTVTLQARLERACRRRVDLVRLDRASTLLRWEAARHAVVVLVEPPREFSRFVQDVALEHADFVSAFGPAAEHFRQRLLALPNGPVLSA